jgi:hypothetical protein
VAEFNMPKTGTWEQRGGWVVRRLEKDAGFTIEQAAGLVGNLGYESNEFRTLQEIKPLIPGSRGGAGWAQWTGPRRRNFEAWCAENALSPSSDKANYGFLLHELKGDFKGFAAKLRLVLSIEDACRMTHEVYERPSDVLDGSYRSGPARLKYAKRALAGAQKVKQDSTTFGAADPVDLCRQMQRALGVEDDGWPGDETYAAMRRWRAGR